MHTNVTSLKRKCAEDCIGNHSRQKRDAFGIVDLPIDILNYISAFLDASDVTALNYTSKSWSNITAWMPMWRDLCRSADLILEEDTPRSAFAKAWQGKNAKVLLAAAKFFSETKSSLKEGNIQKNLWDLQGAKAFADKETLAGKEESIAQHTRFLYALKTRFSYSRLLDDDDAARVFESVLSSAQSLSIRCIAQVMLAEMNLLGRTLVIDQKTALNLIEDMARNAPGWIGAQAIFRIAVLFYAHGIGYLPAEQAAVCIEKTYQNMSCNSSIRQEASELFAKLFSESKLPPLR